MASMYKALSTILPTGGEKKEKKKEKERGKKGGRERRKERRKEGRKREDIVPYRYS